MLMKNFILILFLIFSISCQRNNSSENKIKGDINNKKESNADQKKKTFSKNNSLKKTNVRIQKVNLGSISLQSTYVGNLLPSERVLMKSEIDGIIENIYFKEGEQINKDKKLLDISTNELSLRLDLAKADLKLAETNLTRDKKLLLKNLITKAKLDQTKTLAERAKLNEQIAIINLNKSQIKSPLKGIIKSSYIKTGEFEI